MTALLLNTPFENYSRVPPCGNSSYVDTPLLWTLFSRPVYFSYILFQVSTIQGVLYCGQFANVDTSAWPSRVHIMGTLLYLYNRHVKLPGISK